ncbi:MAG: tetratricopeptide repeat protein [Candidatus Heimdallarchaeota archaeon]|nr:tetratricopeptide repeat protein [Candidatus Heimdallarchaeota archaeon]
MSYLQGLVIFDKREIDEALENFQKSLEYRKKLGDSAGIADVLLKIGSVYNIIGNFELAMENFHKSLEIMERIGKIEGKEKLFLYMGNCHNFKYENKQALSFYKKALAVAKKLGNIEHIAKSTSNIGSIHILNSDFDLALDSFFKALEYSEQLKHILMMSIGYNNLGDIYKLKGELDLALDYTKRSMSGRDEDEKKTEFSAGANIKLGLINQEKGDPTRALHYLLKSLKIREEIGNQAFMADSLIYLCLLSLETRNIVEAEKYLKQLERIQERNKIVILEQGIPLIKALILKASPRTSDKMKAQEMLEKMTKKDFVKSLFPKLVHLNLCELLFYEYTSSQDPRILVEIHSVIDHLLKIAKKQNSLSLLISTNLLSAKLSFLEGDTEQAQQLLIQAQKNAEEKGLTQLAKHISAEYDKLLKRLSHSKDSSINQKEAETDVEELIKQMTAQRQLDVPKVIIDKPVMLLIITQAGMTIFSQTYEKTGKKIDEQLIGGFITAINAFCQEIFSASSSIDRIMYEDYIIAMKNLENMLFCYVFEGDSYTALKKLDEILKKVKQTKGCHQALRERSEQSMYLMVEDEQKLQNIISPILSA